MNVRERRRDAGGRDAYPDVQESQEGVWRLTGSGLESRRAGEEAIRVKNGLLWFDNDPKRSLEEKIAEGAARYARKYGQRPNTCYVNPQMMASETGSKMSTELLVVQAKNVLPHHFWLGISRPAQESLPERTA